MPVKLNSGVWQPGSAMSRCGEEPYVPRFHSQCHKQSQRILNFGPNRHSRLIIQEKANCKVPEGPNQHLGCYQCPSPAYPRTRLGAPEANPRVSGRGHRWHQKMHDSPSRRASKYRMLHSGRGHRVMRQSRVAQQLTQSHTFDPRAPFGSLCGFLHPLASHV